METIQVLIPGTLAAVARVETGTGENFKPHQLLNVVQINDGLVSVVKIKDSNMATKHPENQSVTVRAELGHWVNRGQSGIFIRFLDYINRKQAPVTA